jgi:hypothetical protein
VDAARRSPRPLRLISPRRAAARSTSHGRRRHPLAPGAQKCSARNRDHETRSPGHTQLHPSAQGALAEVERTEILSDPGSASLTDHMVGHLLVGARRLAPFRVQPYGRSSSTRPRPCCTTGKGSREGLRLTPDGSIWSFRPEATCLVCSGRRGARCPELPTRVLDSLREPIAADGDWVPTAPGYHKPSCSPRHLGAYARRKRPHHYVIASLPAYFSGASAPCLSGLDHLFARWQGRHGAAKPAATTPRRSSPRRGV